MFRDEFAADCEAASINRKAIGQGWLLSDNGVSAFNLQRDDDTARFADDDAAALHVIKGALDGDEFHEDVLRFIRDEDPEEWARLIRLCPGIEGF